jgi:5-methylcytosine-specific restriction protein A
VQRMPTFEEVAGSLDQVMGVKAVWGRSSEPVMCFGSRGNAHLRDARHFQQARVTAEKALVRPYLVTVGGGAEVSKVLRGRVLELVRVTGVYGETKAFVRDPVMMARLAQWPVAVVLSEVYRIEVEPRLIEDLGFADKNILNNAYDGVRRDITYMARLWDTLRSFEVSRRWDVEPLPGFRDPGKAQLCSSLYPKVPASSPEGKRIRKEMVDTERDPRLARAVKEINRARNGGIVVCEGCDFSDETAALFDAHHRDPLGKGPRWSCPESFAVLCPTCHRWCHYKAVDILQPLSIPELRASRSISAFGSTEETGGK